jgi:hypothetical protein
MAGILTTEAMLDAEHAVRRIRMALADGLQAHDVPEILSAVESVEADAAEIREQLVIVADVEKDMDAIRRIATVGREHVVDWRYAKRERELERIKGEAPSRVQAVEAQNEAA